MSSGAGVHVGMKALATAVLLWLKARPLLAALWVLLFAGAVGQTVRIGIFMFDPARTEHAVMAGNPFYKTHWCAGSYVRAVELAQAGDPDLYAATHYGPPGKPAYLRGKRPELASLLLDRYEYPPPFLLLPRLAMLVSDDPLQVRAAGFVLEALFLAATYLLVAAWVGGREGTLLALLFPPFWLSFAVLSGLQMGNFHVVMVPLCLLALVAFARRKDVAGGAMLALAVASKLSPGLLVVYLAAQRRWRAVAWTAAFGAALALLALVVFGASPYRAFFGEHLANLASGEAFRFIFDPAAMAARPGPVAGNLSLYGLVFKLHLLGVPGMTAGVARVVSALYLIAILTITVIVGRRSLRAPLDRRRELLLWLGILSLAIFQSPFIPGNYGQLSVAWMLAALGAGERRPVPLMAMAAASLLVWAQHAFFRTGPLLLPVGMAVQALALSLVLWQVLRLRRKEPATVVSASFHSRS
jgi:alpha-1,2-mannosyltransferase